MALAIVLTSMGPPILYPIDTIALIIASNTPLLTVGVFLTITLLFVGFALIKTLLTVEIAACSATFVGARAHKRNPSLCRLSCCKTFPHLHKSCTFANAFDVPCRTEHGSMAQGKQKHGFHLYLGRDLRPPYWGENFQTG